MSKKISDELMEMGEEMFWEEFNSQEKPEDRYIVVDTTGDEIVVSNARFTKKKKKIRV